MSTTSSPAAVPDARATVETGPRGFAAMHRDTWRVARRLWLVMLLLPAVIWFPFDLLAELVATARGDDLLTQLRAYNQVNRITGFLVGGLVSALVLAGVFAYGRGEDESLGAIFGRAKESYGRVLVTSWSFGWRVGLATLLFIVPGIVLACRYALALPITIAEGVSGRDAIAASEHYTEGNRWRIFWYVLAACTMYLLVAMGPVFFVPADDPLWNAVTTLPFNVLSALLTLASALLYVEIAQDRTMAPPVGRVARSETLTAQPETSSGRLGVAVVVVAGLLSFVIGVAFSPDEEPVDLEGAVYEIDDGTQPDPSEIFD